MSLRETKTHEFKKRETFDSSIKSYRRRKLDGGTGKSDRQKCKHLFLLCFKIATHLCFRQIFEICCRRICNAHSCGT